MVEAALLHARCYGMVGQTFGSLPWQHDLVLATAGRAAAAALLLAATHRAIS